MWILSTACEVVVTGHDGEAADLSNPRGEIYGNNCFVTAQDANGNIYAHCMTTRDSEEAARWLVIMQDRMDPTTFDPSDSDFWAFWRHAYGSAAYEANQYENARREREDALDAEVSL